MTGSTFLHLHNIHHESSCFHMAERGWNRSDLASLTHQRQKHSVAQHSRSQTERLVKPFLPNCLYLTYFWWHALISTSIVAAFVTIYAVIVTKAQLITRLCPTGVRTQCLYLRERKGSIWNNAQFLIKKKKTIMLFFLHWFAHWEVLVKDVSAKWVDVVVLTVNGTHTDRSTMIVAAFVISRTVLVTVTSQPWRKGKKKARALAWFQKRTWKKISSLYFNKIGGGKGETDRW